MAEISVIVPVYKVEPYIHRCVDSVLDQTFSDFELILVDDGSPDNCGAICDEYAKKDNRIHVIHQTNGGLSAARNAGIDYAFANSSSEWLTFIDSDDWIHEEMLQRLWDLVNTYSVQVGIAGYINTLEEQPIISTNDCQSRLWKPEEYYTSKHVNATVAWGKLYHKTCFENLRYPAGKIHEDEFLTYRILFAQHEIAVTDVKLYFYYQNTQGITKTTWSPKRLDSVEAIYGQCVYFKKYGFIKAYRQSALCCSANCRAHSAQLQKSQLTEREKLVFQRKIQRCRRRACLAFCDVYFDFDRDMYAEAFPKLFGLYLFLKKCMNTILRRNN